MIVQTADRLNEVQEYYFVKKLQEVAAMQKAGHDVINLGIGSPDMAPSAGTINGLISAAQNPKNHGYQPYRGIQPLRDAMANWYKRTYNVSLNPVTEVLPLLGSKEGIMYISMAFLNPGDEILVPNPGYPAYAAVGKLLGAKIRYYDLKDENNWQPDLDGLMKQDLSKVKLMWVNYPHMPTGTPAKMETFKKLIAFAKEKKVLICHDNPYSLILNDNPQSILSQEGALDVCVELNSFSKSHNMPGWRIGMLMGKEGYLNATLQVKSNVDSGMFLPIQHAAIEALNNTPEWHKKQNEDYLKRRVLAEKLLDLLECSYSKSQVGLFVWGKIPGHINSVEEFTDEILQKAHVFITPGIIFGDNGNRYIRISLCATTETFNKTIERVTDYINKTKKTKVYES